ncbi:hypothetical protein [Leptospira noguchii]|uniref:hypothetical protein n=1 Tax=Leptospira noguchii TaxID=28182 RepID=UPI001FB5AA5F|nr:hypothetical protein [Leptospira noguchii]UOG31594.1 hypothetical protein MAL06_06185 [Leptospira noguchii]
MWGGNLVLQRICRNSHRFNIEIQILVGLVIAPYGSLCRVALTKAKRFLWVALTKAKRFLWVALTQQNASYGSR